MMEMLYIDAPRPVRKQGSMGDSEDFGDALAVSAEDVHRITRRDGLSLVLLFKLGSQLA